MVGILSTFIKKYKTLSIAIMSTIFSMIAVTTGIVILFLDIRERPSNKAIIEEHPIALKAPFLVENYFYPSGFMGDGEIGNKYISLTHERMDVNGLKKVVTKISYNPGPKGWGGIYWQYPENNWGKHPGRNLIGARKISFLAKGAVGGEIVEFISGGIQGEYNDSFKVSLGKLALLKSWKEYSIDLSQEDLSNVIGAFAWVASKDANPDGITFYLKDIYFER